MRQLVETVIACVLTYIFLLFSKTRRKTLLIKLSALGRHMMVEVLLRSGCNPNARDEVVYDLKLTVLKIFISVI